MKRSNRLILLIGVALAIVAFVGIVLLSSGTQQPGQPETPQVAVIYATQDIQLGELVREDQVESRMVDQLAAPAGAINDVNLVVGRVARRTVVAGTPITSDVFADQTLEVTRELDRGLRAISVQVDQVSGVGALIKTGDRVDVLASFEVGVSTFNPDNNQIQPVAGLDQTTVKLLLQNLEVIGTLHPPVQQVEGQAGDPAPALTGQQEIVILAVNPQQSEIIKFSQVRGNVSLVLRSPQDYVDPETNEPIDPTTIPLDPTTGIVLKTLVDEYGVIPPQIVEAILPESLQPTP